MGYKLTFLEKIYYSCVNTLICAVLLDHPEYFSVLVNYLIIKETITNIIIDFIYIHSHILILNILTFFYLCFYFFNDLIKLLRAYEENIQLIIFNPISNTIYCFKLLVEGKKYSEMYATFTNFNLKNTFIRSAIFIYIFYSLNLIEIFYVSGQHLSYFILDFIIRGNINLHDLFYLKFEFVSHYNIQSVFLMFILLAIVLHGTIGLYMLFFDYLKPSSFYLWTLLIYLIIVFIFVFFLNNENLYVNFLNILPINPSNIHVFHI